MANLGAMNPPAQAEKTVAALAKDVYDNAYELRGRMKSLTIRAGLAGDKDSPSTAVPEPGQLFYTVNELIRLVSDCHNIMNDLDRIA